MTLLGCERLAKDSQAWRQDRLDIAKIMLTRTNLDSAMDPASAEAFADSLFEIGRSSYQRDHFSEAIYWLEKAHDAISNQHSHELSSDAGELQNAIMHNLARAYLNQGSEGQRTKAWDLIRRLDLDHGDSLAVSVLKLDAFALDFKCVPQEYCDVLLRIVHSAHMMDSNIKIILHHAHRLRSVSSLAAHTVLLALFQQRLMGTGKRKWLEKTFITIVWNLTTTEFSDVPSSFTELLDTLVSNPDHALSPSAIHAAQTVSLVITNHAYADEWSCCRSVLKQALSKTCLRGRKPGVGCASTRHSAILDNQIPENCSGNTLPANLQF